VAGFAGCDTLDKWHVDVRVGALQGKSVGLEKQTDHDERGAFVAVGERVVSRQPLKQHRGFLNQRRLALNVAEPGARSSQRGLSKIDVRQPRHLLSGNAKDICGCVTEVPELGVVHLLAELAQRLAMLGGETLTPSRTGLLIPGKPAL
jgi:hypothetical protein